VIERRPSGCDGFILYTLYFILYQAIRMRRLRRATPRVVVAVERPDGSLTPAYVTSEVELKDLEDAAAASRATVPGADTGTSTSGLLSVPINLNAASRI